MPEVKWIKLKTNMFEDEKIDFIESLPENDAILLIWIKLLALAGKCNFGGFIHLTEDIPYTVEMLSHKFKRPLNVVKLAIETFKKLGMVDIIDGRICLVDFSADQNMDKLESIREYNRIAKQNERNRKKILLSQGKESYNENANNIINDLSMTNVNDSQGFCQTDSIDISMNCPRSQNIDEDIDKDKDIYNYDDDINNIYNQGEPKEKSSSTSNSFLTFSDNTKVEIFYELNIGKLSSIVKQGLEYYRQRGLSDGVIKMAIMTAVSNSTAAQDKKNWSYINAILEDCLKKNIKTLEEFYAKENAYQLKKQSANGYVTKSPEEKNKSSTLGVDFIGNHAFKV
ncbi:phage replisome organizer N-terminal domain-containing protein [Ruminiclostridium cellobioparum]|uniref:phage replisome organizer N-terminal domain-containing protein n=1 Tax=Ruminiclostridium cellobioparum TaxID=29355 RepID=UPI0028A64DEF|nr:phage replisome organizer N-terminal domain-containing protein [Ruminiclostridium cellobioparum]